MKHPEKWYIPVTEENREELQPWWQEQVRKSGWGTGRLYEDRLLLSEHPKDSSYYWSGDLEYFTSLYPSYQEITLEQFREITNPHPEYWCIEANEENFKELYAWWRSNADERYTHFQVGYTLVSDHPNDESKYYGGSIANCLDDYPQFAEITLEQFRQITNSNQTQTTMTKQIQISRELLNEYYEAATTPQRAYLSEHFKLDGRTTDEAIRGLHDLACSTWKPRIKKNHPECFEDEKYFDFSAMADEAIVAPKVAQALGLSEDFIEVRQGTNPKLRNRSFYLSTDYNWELVNDGEGIMVLIPSKKQPK